MYKLCSDEMFKGYIKSFVEDYDLELVRMKQINEVFQNIITDTNYISEDKLNSNELVINFENGLLSLTKYTTFLTPHFPEVYSTIQIPCNWSDDPKPTPVFDSYLDTLTNGDEGVKNLLLQYMGACFSNVKGYRMKKALFLTGDGDTGKSQLKSLVERILGRGNFIGIDLREIESRFGTGAIYGKRLAGSSDMSFMSVTELKAFKKITGGDSLFAEFKGQQGFEYTYGGLLWFCMNRLPKFGGDDGEWVYDRIMVVDCKNVIPKDRQDRTLCDQMYAEREGIIHKAVKAFLKVIKNGWVFPALHLEHNAKEPNAAPVAFRDEFAVIHIAVDLHPRIHRAESFVCQIRQADAAAAQAGPGQHCPMILFQILQHLRAARRQARMITEVVFEPSVKIDTPFHLLSSVCCLIRAVLCYFTP